MLVIVKLNKVDDKQNRTEQNTNKSTAKKKEKSNQMVESLQHDIYEPGGGSAATASAVKF